LEKYLTHHIGFVINQLVLELLLLVVVVVGISSFPSERGISSEVPFSFLVETLDFYPFLKIHMKQTMPEEFNNYKFNYLEIDKIL